MPLTSLQQEYYEVLHSCIALAPAFASDAYYVNKVRCSALHATQAPPRVLLLHVMWFVPLVAQRLPTGGTAPPARH